MADPILRQFSFTAGEISQEIEGKLDSSKRQQALRRLLNAYITFGGTLQKRPGLQLAVVNERPPPDNPTPGVNYAPRLVRWAGSRNEPDLLMVISAYEAPVGEDHGSVFSFMTANRMRFTETLADIYAIRLTSPPWALYDGYWLMRDGRNFGRVVINSLERATEEIAAGHFSFSGTFQDIKSPVPPPGDNLYRSLADISSGVTDHQNGGNAVNLENAEFQATSRAARLRERIIYDITINGESVYAIAEGSMPSLTDQTSTAVRNAQENFDSLTGPYYTLVQIQRLFEVRTPYLWKHVWHDEDDFDDTERDSEPGLKFAQSSDVMTITHPDYPVHSLERNESDIWQLSQTVFDFEQKAPTGLYIRNYLPRAPAEGFDPNRAEGRPVDFAVTAYNDVVGESRFGSALTDTRFFAPENEPGNIMARMPGVRTQQTFTGFEVSQQNPGLFVRIALFNSQDEDDVKAAFPPGTAVHFLGTLGTRGLHQRIFQVREFRGSVAKGEDQRVTHFSAVSGVAAADLENTGWRGPWLVLEPAPPAKVYENIYAVKVGTGLGADTIGDVGTAEDADDTNPYNLDPRQVPE